jgi:hypothetical protein
MYPEASQKIVSQSPESAGAGNAFPLEDISQPWPFSSKLVLQEQSLLATLSCILDSINLSFRYNAASKASVEKGKHE